VSRSDDALSWLSSRRWLLVFLVWAVMYLPSLGSLEIKGEEGRRILPAVTMLETGNYVVPYVGGEPYLRKPPLVNWLVAGSFKLFGARNEWTARIPSVLCVLAVAIAFLALARSSLGDNGSLFAALMWLTSFGMIEKGRLIEIEALYVSLYGLAMICWLAWWQQRRTPWLTWTVPLIVLGFGLLAKGPLHLVFFYSVVLAVLFGKGELRRLFHPAHILGIAMMIGIFALWAMPYLRMTEGANSAEVWVRQFTGRVSGEEFELGGWVWNIPRAIGYCMPWVVLLVFLPAALRQSNDRQLMRWLTWGIAVPFVVVNLLPGALPRYTMPLLVPAIWLIAMILTTPQLTAPRMLRNEKLLAATRPRFVVGLSLAIAAAILVYAVALVPFLRKREKVRNVAAQIQAGLPEVERLYAIDPEYQPFLFYIRSPLTYVPRVGDLPAEARFFVVEARKVKDVQASHQWGEQRPREIARVTDYRRKTVILYSVDPVADSG
jgi:4-amino-4-deoxy-L-arabinose transferase-like glycosyltransferase